MLPDHIRKAVEEYIPHMEGWLTVARGLEMAELIIDRKPQVVVEIGVFGGRSLVAQAFALRENMAGMIYGIDPWQVDIATEGFNDHDNNEWWRKNIDISAIHQGCMNSIWGHHLEPWVTVIRSASYHVAQLFPHNIDVLYVDGNHSEQSSCRDVELYVPRVKPGGAIWFDDTSWETTQKALRLTETMATLEREYSNYRLYIKR